MSSSPETHKSNGHPSANTRQVGGNHYASNTGYQHWDFATDLGLCWTEGCATKYLARLFGKTVPMRTNAEQAVEDAEKVVHYLEKQLELLREDRLPLSTYTTAGTRKYVASYMTFAHSALEVSKAPNDVKEVQHKLFENLSSWKFDVRGPEIALNTCLKIARDLVLKVRAHVPDTAYPTLLTEEHVNEEQEPQEDLRAYVAQAEEPQVPTLVAPKEPSAPTQEKKLNLVEQLRLTNNQAYQMLTMQRSAAIPLEVYRDMLEQYRRKDDLPRLNTNPRVPPNGNNLVYTAFRDYAEPMLKIQLGMQALEESLPNRQLLRSLLGLSAVSDGLQSMMHWMVLSTEGPFPAIATEEERDQVRVAGYFLRNQLAEAAAAVFAKSGVSSSLYTVGLEK